MKVYVVTYTPYIYPEGGEEDFKNLMNSQTKVKGVYYTKEAAEAWIDKWYKEFLEECDGEDYHEDITEKDHYDIIETTVQRLPR